MGEKEYKQTHSVYIHIPFCNKICSYCDFCKMFYNSNLSDKYLDELKREIDKNYLGEEINTIYIGGGTPSCLLESQIKKLLEIIKKFNIKNLEYTIECNIEDINEDKLKIFKQYGINRISIGVQSLNDRHIKFLNRNHNQDIVKNRIEIVKKYFDNINIDLIYALPNQTLDELLNDLNFIINLGVSHISTYSLIIEENTKLFIDNISNIDEDIDYKMYNLICDKLEKNGYIHYEVSNFSKPGYESKHNLVYWNNERYYGFGLGASGYIQNIRYENTRSIKKYLNGNYILKQHNLNLKEIIENEFILGFRKIKGINKKSFYDKYSINLCDLDIIKKLLKSNDIIDDGENIFINKNRIYTENDILINFID